MWKEIPSWNGVYSASQIGEIRNNKTGRILKQQINKAGYKCLGLSKDGLKVDCRVHRLVAEAFIENIENKKTVNHKNGDRTNNCVENLEWATQSENVKHGWSVLGRVATKNWKDLSKPVAQFSLLGELIKNFKSQKDAAMELKINNVSISNSCRGVQKTAGGFKWEYAKKAVL